MDNQDEKTSPLTFCERKWNFIIFNIRCSIMSWLSIRKSEPLIILHCSLAWFVEFETVWMVTLEETHLGSSITVTCFFSLNFDIENYVCSVSLAVCFNKSTGSVFVVSPLGPIERVSSKIKKYLKSPKIIFLYLQNETTYSLKFCIVFKACSVL